MISDEEAVSPVIAVILLIAITIVLGGVIGVFVFGVTDGFADSPPNTGVSFEYVEDENDLSITHAGGKLLMTSNTGVMRVSGSGVTDADGGEWNSNHFDHDPSTHDSTEAVLENTVEVGHVIWTTETGQAEISSGETIQLIWVSPDGSESDSLGSFEAP